MRVPIHGLRSKENSACIQKEHICDRLHSTGNPKMGGLRQGGSTVLLLQENQHQILWLRQTIWGRFPFFRGTPFRGWFKGKPRVSHAFEGGVTKPLWPVFPCSPYPRPTSMISSHLLKGRPMIHFLRFTCKWETAESSISCLFAAGNEAMTQRKTIPGPLWFPAQESASDSFSAPGLCHSLLSTNARATAI